MIAVIRYEFYAKFRSTAVSGFSRSTAPFLTICYLNMIVNTTRLSVTSTVSRGNSTGQIRGPVDAGLDYGKFVVNKVIDSNYRDPPS